MVLLFSWHLWYCKSYAQEEKKEKGQKRSREERPPPEPRVFEPQAGNPEPGEDEIIYGTYRLSKRKKHLTSCLEFLSSPTLCGFGVKEMVRGCVVAGHSREQDEALDAFLSESLHFWLRISKNCQPMRTMAGGHGVLFDHHGSHVHTPTVEHGNMVKSCKTNGQRQLLFIS